MRGIVIALLYFVHLAMPAGPLDRAPGRRSAYGQRGSSPRVDATPRSSLSQPSTSLSCPLHGSQSRDQTCDSTPGSISSHLTSVRGCPGLSHSSSLSEPNRLSSRSARSGCSASPSPCGWMATEAAKLNLKRPCSEPCPIPSAPFPAAAEPPRRRRRFHALVASKRDSLRVFLVFPPPPPRLLSFDEAPSWMQQNSCIRSGYRPELGSFRACVRSLAFAHNELRQSALSLSPPGSRQSATILALVGNIPSKITWGGALTRFLGAQSTAGPTLSRLFLVS